MLVEVCDYGLQVEFKERCLNPNNYKRIAINTNEISYIVETIREWEKIKTYFYKVVLNNGVVFYIDYQDYERLGVKEIK